MSLVEQMADDRNAPPAVEFDRVSFGFDDHVILRDVSFTIPKGTMTILLGESGVGKSITLKLILRLLRPDGGAIRVNGERVDTMSEQELMRVRGDIGVPGTRALRLADGCRERGLPRTMPE